MTKVVIDTNVIVSALMSPFGKPAEILDLFFDGEMHIFYSSDILSEYTDVLSRPSLRIKPEKAKKFLQILESAGIANEPPISNIQLPDESDRIFYDVTKANGAILITGNTKHYPSEPFIMTPAEFLRKVGFLA